MSNLNHNPIIKNIPLKDIKPYSNNPRKKQNITKVVNSIKEFGFQQPIVVDKKNIIIVGHSRYEAGKELGLDKVPVIIADLSPVKAKAYRIADNRINQDSEWDFSKLTLEFKDISKLDFNLDSLGFEKNELDDLIIDEVKGFTDDDAVPDKPKKPKSKLGEIYQLGHHRVMCGDATKEEDVNKLMNGQKADMVFTDPPYGMKKENEGVLNDNLNYNDLLKFNKQWIPLTFSALKDNGSWYCWGRDEPLMDIYSEIIKTHIRHQKATFRNLITWDKFSNQKPTAIESMRSYVVYEEKCLFIMMGVQGFNNNADNYFEGWEPIRKYLKSEMEKVGGRKSWKEALGNQMGSHYFTKSQWELPTKEAYEKLQNYSKGKSFKKEYDELKKEYYNTRSYFNNTHETYMTSVWRFDSHQKDGSEGNHATPKPIELCERGIKSSSEKNNIVLDLFGGSGSTLIACEKINRNCYMMELDPIYVDVIIKRWEDYTGKSSKKI